MTNKLTVYQVNSEEHASAIIRKLRISQASKVRYQSCDIHQLGLNISELNRIVANSFSSECSTEKPIYEPVQMQASKKIDINFGGEKSSITKTLKHPKSNVKYDDDDEWSADESEDGNGYIKYIYIFLIISFNWNFYKAVLI